MTTEQTWAALKEAAEKATPGPWVARQTVIYGQQYGGFWVEGIDLDPDDARFPERLIPISGSGGARSYTTRIFEQQIHDDNDNNVQYVACANPKTVLALEAEYQRLKAENERLRTALTELSDAVRDGLCNSGTPGFDAGRLDRALTAARAALAQEGE